MKKEPTKIIHVSQPKIRANKKHGKTDPVLTCKLKGKHASRIADGSNVYAHEAIIYGQDGKEAARVIYRPNKPLSCGARVWIETRGEVKTIIFDEEREQ
jgi:hypothetical protein